MLISFDLDETLICRRGQVASEPNQVPWVFRAWFDEPLRLGFCRLYRELRQKGWQVCIYTTSLRPAWQIRFWLWWYGVRLAKVINQSSHAAQVGQTLAPCPSKHPPSYDIWVHVDDSELVVAEGERYGFKTILVKPTDTDWVDQILASLENSQTKRKG